VRGERGLEQVDVALELVFSANASSVMPRMAVAHPSKAATASLIHYMGERSKRRSAPQPVSRIPAKPEERCQREYIPIIKRE
jgi:hypothetical protein